MKNAAHKMQYLPIIALWSKPPCILMKLYISINIALKLH